MRMRQNSALAKDFLLSTVTYGIVTPNTRKTLFCINMFCKTVPSKDVPFLKNLKYRSLKKTF